jgi:hypothetical protein
MPRVTKTAGPEAARILREADRQALETAMMYVAASALDDSESGADTAAVVYEQLANLGIIVP